MKSLLGTLLGLLLISGYVFADGRFDGVLDEACPEKVEDKHNDILYCAADMSKDVLAAKVGSSLNRQGLKELGFSTYSAVDIGLVPDADSSTAYYYIRWLVNAKKQKVGILTIEGWHNSEMDSSARFDTRYNLKGQVVSIEIKPISKVKEKKVE